MSQTCSQHSSALDVRCFTSSEKSKMFIHSCDLSTTEDDKCNSASSIAEKYMLGYFGM